jgi:hypothetical protein
MVVRNLALAALLIPSLICPAWPPLLPFILGAATGSSLYLLTVLFNAIAALSIPVRQPRI